MPTGVIAMIGAGSCPVDRARNLDYRPLRLEAHHRANHQPRPTIEAEIHDSLYNRIKNWHHTGLLEVYNAWEGKGFGLRRDGRELVKPGNGPWRTDGLCLIEVPFEDTYMAQPLVSEKVANRRRPRPAWKPEGVWSANPIVVLWGTMVGKKVVMAVTGVVLVGFVIAHMLGNIKIFIGVEAIRRLCGVSPRDGRASASRTVRSCGWPASSCSSASCSTSSPPSSSRS